MGQQEGVKEEKDLQSRDTARTSYEKRKEITF